MWEKGWDYKDTETNSLDDLEPDGTEARTQGTNVKDYFANYFMGLGAVLGAVNGNNIKNPANVGDNHINS